MTKVLQHISHALRMVWLLFPAILFILLSLLAFSSIDQGKDVLLMAAEREGAATLLVLATTFLAFMCWYTARLVMYAYEDIKQKDSTPTRIFWNKTFPRVLGYATFFSVQVGIISHPYFKSDFDTVLIIGLLLIQVLIYYFIYKHFKKNTDYKKFTIWLIVIVLVIVLILTFAFSSRGSIRSNFLIQLIGLWVVQTCFLIWNFIRSQKLKKDTFIIRWEYIKLSGLKIVRLPATEIPFFKGFNIAVLGISVLYFATIFSIPTSRFVGSFNIVMLSFSVLVGFLHVVTLITLWRKINLHFLLFVFSIITGLFTSPYSLRKTEVNAPVYNNRITLKKYTKSWIDNNRDRIAASDSFPMYFVLSDGGSSRSAYWVSGALGKLRYETENSFDYHLFCISGASGGSVGNAVFYSLLDKASTDVVTDTTNFSKEARQYLRSDFLSYTLSHMLGPDFFNYLVPIKATSDRGGALELSMENSDSNPDVGKLFAKPYSKYLQSFKPEKLPIFFINTTRVQNGSPGVISNIKLDSTYTSRADVLTLLDKAGTNCTPFGDINLSTAAVLSSRFPYLSPAANINNHSYFVDGGYFDNSGAGIVMEAIAGIKALFNKDTLSFPKHITSKLQFHIIHLSNSQGSTVPTSRVHPIVNDLFAPLLTLANSYGQQTNINNFRLRKFISAYVNDNCDNCWTRINLYDQDTAIDEDVNAFSMNWVISDTTLSRMDRRLEKNPTLNKLIGNIRSLKD